MEMKSYLACCVGTWDCTKRRLMRQQPMTGRLSGGEASMLSPTLTSLSTSTFLVSPHSHYYLVPCHSRVSMLHKAFAALQCTFVSWKNKTLLSFRGVRCLHVTHCQELMFGSLCLPRSASVMIVVINNFQPSDKWVVLCHTASSGPITVSLVYIECPCNTVES